MDDNECDMLYQQLAAMMTNMHMEWIIKEAEEHIVDEEGKIFDEEDTEDYKQLALPGSFVSAKKVSLPEKASIAQNRLIMLIDYIYHIVVHPAECKHFLFRTLRRKEIREVIFLSPNGNGRKLILDKEPIQQQLHMARQLGRVLQSLRDSVIKGV